MKSTDKIRIVIIEDNRFVRDAWKITFESVPGFEVVGSFQSCEDAFKDEEIILADVVMLDIRLPGISGIEGAKYLNEKYPQQLIVMCTLYEDDENIFNAILAGAVGFISKRTTPSELVKSIINLLDGGSPMTPNVARRLLQLFQANENRYFRNGSSISEFEIKLLNFIAVGKSYSTIADELSISVQEVQSEIRNIYNKLHQKLVIK